FRMTRERLAQAVADQNGAGRVAVAEAGHLDELVTPFLPDHLVQRARLVRHRRGEGRRRARLVITHEDGRQEVLVEEPLSWREMSRIGASLSDTPVVGRRADTPPGPIGELV